MLGSSTVSGEDDYSEDDDYKDVSDIVNINSSHKKKLIKPFLKNVMFGAKYRKLQDVLIVEPKK